MTETNVEKLAKALKEQHDWHLAQGEQDFGDGIKLNMADEYGESAMCARTIAALDTAAAITSPEPDTVREKDRADLAEKHLNQIYDYLGCCRSGSAVICTIKEREAALSSATVEPFGAEQQEAGKGVSVMPRSLSDILASIVWHKSHNTVNESILHDLIREAYAALPGYNPTGMQVVPMGGMHIYGYALKDMKIGELGIFVFDRAEVTALTGRTPSENPAQSNPPKKPEA